MPTISMFYGIIIRMHCANAEHNPPHFHALYAGYKCTVNINTGEIKGKDFPNKQAKLIVAWTEIHKEELLANWRIASNGELPYEIKPL